MRKHATEVDRGSRDRETQGLMDSAEHTQLYAHTSTHITFYHCTHAGGIPTHPPLKHTHNLYLGIS